MRTLFSNRYAKALATTIVFFGSLHILILVFLASRGSIQVLNAFSIVSLNLVIPSLGEGLVNFIISWGIVLAFYGFAYVFLTRPLNKDKS